MCCAVQALVGSLPVLSHAGARGWPACVAPQRCSRVACLCCNARVLASGLLALHRTGACGWPACVATHWCSQVAFLCCNAWALAGGFLVLRCAGACGWPPCVALYRCSRVGFCASPLAALAKASLGCAVAAPCRGAVLVLRLCCVPRRWGPVLSGRCFPGVRCVLRSSGGGGHRAAQEVHICRGPAVRQALWPAIWPP